MARMYLKLFTRSVERREPQIFVESLKHYFGDTGLPDVFSANDDESFPFNLENIQQFANLWWDGYVNWHGRAQKMIGSVGLGNWGCHTTISHSLECTPALEENCADFLIAASLALHADYAYTHLLSEDKAKVRPDDQRLAGAVALDLGRALPGVPWAACYGRPYIDLFGGRNLLTMPVKVVHRLSDDMIYCQLTENVRDALERPDDLAVAQAVVFERLGRNAFYNRDDPDRDEVHYVDRSSGKILAPAWPDPITVPAVTSKKFWAGK